MITNHLNSDREFAKNGASDATGLQKKIRREHLSSKFRTTSLQNHFRDAPGQHDDKCCMGVCSILMDLMSIGCVIQYGVFFHFYALIMDMYVIYTHLSFDDLRDSSFLTATRTQPFTVLFNDRCHGFGESKHSSATPGLAAQLRGQTLRSTSIEPFPNLCSFLMWLSFFVIAI